MMGYHWMMDRIHPKEISKRWKALQNSMLSLKAKKATTETPLLPQKTGEAGKIVIKSPEFVKQVPQSAISRAKENAKRSTEGSASGTKAWISCQQAALDQLPRADDIGQLRERADHLEKLCRDVQSKIREESAIKAQLGQPEVVRSLQTLGRKVERTKEETLKALELREKLQTCLGDLTKRLV